MTLEDMWRTIKYLILLKGEIRKEVKWKKYLSEKNSANYNKYKDKDYN